MIRIGVVAAAVIVVGAACGSAGRATSPSANSLATSSTAGPNMPTTTTALPALPPAGFLSAPVSGDRHTVIEWGWDGTQLRTLHIAGVVDCCTTIFLSPDGTRLLVLGAVGNAGEILDLEGHVLAHGSDIDGHWADDSRHLCLVRPHKPQDAITGGPADLVLVDPGHGARVVAQVGGYGPHSEPGLLRCSVRDDQALVTQSFVAETLSVSAVRLSDGAVTTPSWVPPTPETNSMVAVSGDGRYALLRSYAGGPEGEVVDTTTNAVVAHTDGQPGDLSWDGHVVVETDGTGERLRAENWQTHVTNWLSRAQEKTGPWPDPSYAFASRQNSDDVALAITNQPHEPYGEAELWFYRGDIATRLVAAVRFGII